MTDTALFEALERDWRPWVVKLTCCGRDNGEYRALTWEEADSFRGDYLSGPAVAGPGRSPLALMVGHDRSAIIVSSPAAEPPSVGPGDGGGQQDQDHGGEAGQHERT